MKEEFLPLIAIDSATTRDIDDAFSLKKVEQGYLLTVVIADPTSEVKIASEIDWHARKNVATVYRRDAAILKMLPPSISEDKCSLIRDKLRTSMVIQMNLDSSLAVTDTTIQFKQSKVTHSLDHAQISRVLAQPDHELQPTVKLAAMVAQQKLNQRRGAGALALYDLQKLLATDEEGRIRLFESKEQVMGYIIVQEFMILTNVALANYLLQNDIPAIFRNHVPRQAAPSSTDMADTLQGWIDHGNANLEEKAMQLLLQVGAAAYEPCVKGHYGLAETAYTHVTSPLRRYVDLVNIRQLKAFVEGAPIPYSQADLDQLAKHINTVLTDRIEERSAHFKAMAKAGAARLMDQGKLLGADDAVLVQAIKIAAAESDLHQSLEAELNRLFDRGIITEKVTDAMLVRLPVSLWPQELARKYVSWLQDVPARAMHALNHGKHSEFFNYAFESQPAQTGFEGRCLLQMGELRWQGAGTSVRKRDAEQAAAISALAAMLQLEDGAPPSTSGKAQAQSSVSSDTQHQALQNAKGELITYCQRNQVEAPRISFDSSGPSHQPLFSCTVIVGAVTATSTAGSKKQSEAQACSTVLSLLACNEERASGAKGKANDAPQTLSAQGVNYKGQLLELCQKNRWNAPLFESVATGPTHMPSFSVTASLNAGGVLISVSGVGGTKKTAEAIACRDMLKELGH
ncbi:RNB domain-containing ribonuclease [Comamonas thiooxydans]|uniref:RNB domain-containing ribonuclease n=1 Tax=Comamonas thiooxydans TaxID=363952 RepID=UPI0005104C98|nr:RNB domain-containing ribonuclease [Comamonas thiooxydans]KGH23567.1 hypothetical protein P606_11660 [Comamonas thiooxydans]